MIFCIGILFVVISNQWCDGVCWAFISLPCNWCILKLSKYKSFCIFYSVFFILLSYEWWIIESKSGLFFAHHNFNPQTSTVYFQLHVWMNNFERWLIQGNKVTTKVVKLWVYTRWKRKSSKVSRDLSSGFLCI